MKKHYLKVGSTSVNPEGYGYPRIRLQGNWLDEAGFSIGDKIEVICNINQLVITRLVMEEEQKARQATAKIAEEEGFPAVASIILKDPVDQRR